MLIISLLAPFTIPAFILFSVVVGVIVAKMNGY